SNDITEILYSFNNSTKNFKHTIKNIQIQSEKVSKESDSLKSQNLSLTDVVDKQVKATDRLFQEVNTIHNSTEEIHAKSMQQKQHTEKTKQMMLDFQTHIDSMIDSIEGIFAKYKVVSDNVILSKDDFEQSSQEIQKIHSSTSKISEVVSVITDIADRVNLLSLNASIEAARAGDSGKGFAVVAKEIAILAEKTHENINLIQNIFKAMIESINEGISSSEKSIGFIFKIFDDIFATEEEFLKIRDIITGQKEKNQQLIVNIQNLDVDANTIQEVTLGQNNNFKTIQETMEKFSESSEKVYQSAKVLKNLSEDLNGVSQTLNQTLKFYQV
ncbi:MAG: methyl-accepting chemotaxis protein, partial [Spirochaetota bacterium]